MDLVKHQILFYLFGIIPIRDTIVITVILDVIIIAAVLFIRKAYPSLIEMIIKFISTMVDDILDVENIYPYLPILGSLFIFLFFANILSLIPVLRSPTSDVNTTFALAIVVFFAVHIYGIWKKGFFGYLKTLSNPIFLLPLDLISQISRTLSLTLRLFGNILSGEIIVAIVFSIIPLLAPIPFIALSMLSGVLQAYILTTLATLYIGSAVEINQSGNHQKKNKQILKQILNRKDNHNGKS